MPAYKVCVTDGHDYARVTIETDNIHDACGHAIDGVQSFEIILNQQFEGDYDDVYIDSIELDGNGFDVPEQYIHWKDQEIARLTREIVRLKNKCGEL